MRRRNRWRGLELPPRRFIGWRRAECPDSRGGQAWLAHYNDNQLSRCSVLATGEFDRCENAIYPATASGPYGMSATDTHLFISQVQGNALSRCALDPAGNLSDCSDVLTDLAQPSGITTITLP